MKFKCIDQFEDIRVAAAEVSPGDEHKYFLSPIGVDVVAFGVDCSIEVKDQLGRVIGNYKPGERLFDEHDNKNQRVTISPKSAGLYLCIASQADAALTGSIVSAAPGESLFLDPGVIVYQVGEARLEGSRTSFYINSSASRREHRVESGGLFVCLLKITAPRRARKK